MELKTEVEKVYGGKLRVRVCGICIQEQKLLLIKHKFGEKDYLWSPPGGGLDFGESIEEALIREYQEEVNIKVKVGELLFVNEFLSPPYHAIELMMEVEQVDKNEDLAMGFDPESGEHQIIEEIAFLSIEDLKAVPRNYLHNCLQDIDSFSELYQQKRLLSHKPS